MRFSPELIARVRDALGRMGFCFLSHDELNRLLAEAPRNLFTRHSALQAFAQVCGAEVEATEHLTSARFVPAAREQEYNIPQRYAGYPDVTLNSRSDTSTR
jgi:hypothetical protein